jgi:4-amino-4-deoxy-L-arabinose transferase-like glycosyltransferase
MPAVTSGNDSAAIGAERAVVAVQAGGDADRRVPLPALILGVALGVRLVFVFALPDYHPVFDGRDYDSIARSLVRGGGYMMGPKATAFRPPGYAFFLAGIYWVTGTPGTKEAAEIIRAVQACLGTVAVGLLGAVAAMLWGRRTALAALALGAVYVPFVEVGEAYVSEALFLPLMLGALFCALRQRQAARKWRWSTGSGVLIGLAILTRPNGIVVVLPLGLALWHGERRRSWRTLKNPVIMLLAAVITVTPWTVRNAVTSHSFIPVSTDLGETLAGTYNDASRHNPSNPAAWRVPRKIAPYRSIFLRPIGEHRRDSALTGAALGYVEAHPRYVVTVAWWNTRRLVDLAGMRRSRLTAATIGVGPNTAMAGVVCFWLVALLAVIGATRPLARRTPPWFWACPALLYASIVLVTTETPRFRSSLDPFIVLLAAIGTQSLRNSTLNPVRVANQ